MTAPPPPPKPTEKPAAVPNTAQVPPTVKPVEPAPIVEKVNDIPPPPTKEPINVIKKDGPGKL